MIRLVRRPLLVRGCETRAVVVRLPSLPPLQSRAPRLARCRAWTRAWFGGGCSIGFGRATSRWTSRTSPTCAPPRAPPIAPSARDSRAPPPRPTAAPPGVGARPGPPRAPRASSARTIAPSARHRRHAVVARENQCRDTIDPIAPRQCSKIDLKSDQSFCHFSSTTINTVLCNINTIYSSWC